MGDEISQISSAKDMDFPVSQKEESEWNIGHTFHLEAQSVFVSFTWSRCLIMN